MNEATIKKPHLPESHLDNGTAPQHLSDEDIAAGLGAIDSAELDESDANWLADHENS